MLPSAYLDDLFIIIGSFRGSSFQQRDGYSNVQLITLPITLQSILGWRLNSKGLLMYFAKTTQFFPASYYIKYTINNILGERCLLHGGCSTASPPPFPPTHSNPILAEEDEPAADN